MKQKAKKSSIVLNGIYGGLAATALNAVIYYLTKWAGVSYMMPPRDEGGVAEMLPAWAVFVSSFMPALVAILILLILNRFTKRPFRFFFYTALVVLLVSFIPVIAIDVPVYTKFYLGTMHIIAAGAILLFFRQAYRSR